MGEELLWVEIQDNIGWIKINREKKLNALNQNLIDALHHTFIDFQNNFDDILETSVENLLRRVEFLENIFEFREKCSRNPTMC